MILFVTRFSLEYAGIDRAASVKLEKKVKSEPLPRSDHSNEFDPIIPPVPIVATVITTIKQPLMGTSPAPQSHPSRPALLPHAPMHQRTAVVDPVATTPPRLLSQLPTGANISSTDAPPRLVSSFGNGPFRIHRTANSTGPTVLPESLRSNLILTLFYY